LRARRHCAGRIVREAKINDIRVFARRFRHKIILHRAGQIKNAFVAAVGANRAGVARHHIGIDVNRINRVGDGDFVLLAENIEDVTAVTF
jgi:hypothetical protein